MSTPPTVSPARAWTIAGLLFAAGFLNYLDRAIVSVALPVIAVDLHLGPAAKGLLLSAFFWSYALMQMPMGWAADRYNLRWFYAGAFTIWSLACGLTGFAGSLGVLLFMRVLLGIGESIYVPGGVKIVSLVFNTSDRGLASGLMNSGTRAGLALGAPLIAWLVGSTGWHESFLVLGFGSLAWLIPWLLVYPGHVNSSGGTRAPGLRQIFAALDRNLLGLCLGHIAFSYYWYLLVTWLPDYLVESRHMTLQRAGAYTTIPFLVFGASEPLGGWIADRLVEHGRSECRARKIVVTAAFFTSIMLLIAGRMADDTAAVLMIGAASLVGLATGNLYALLASVAPQGAVGTWMGILNFAGNISGILAPIVTGLLIARTGSYYPGFVVAVVILHLGLPAYWWMVSEKQSATVAAAGG
ncbi:MAG TPA: MFS transporter [Candidatus Acidoferrales bacterium]|nr:MFS transporter [Candidatus Acidoferrales bacterium]